MEKAAHFEKFIRTYHKGEIVFEEGSSGEVMYVIASGAVTLTTVKHGRETLLARMGPGEFFGEMALVDAQPRSGTIRIDEEDTRLIELDIDRFLYLIQQQPIFALTIMQNLCQHIRRREVAYLDLVQKLEGNLQ
jgi:CRP/FNR family transcriptional regulator, cyclic AMP receptor protein